MIKYILLLYNQKYYKGIYININNYIYNLINNHFLI